MRRVNYELRVLQAITSLPEKTGAILEASQIVSPDDFTSPYRELYIEILSRYESGLTYRLVDLADLDFTDQRIGAAIAEVIEVSNQETYSKESLIEFCDIIKKDSQMRNLKTLGEVLSRESQKTSAQVKNLLRAIDDTVMEINKRSADVSLTSSQWLTSLEESNAKLKGKNMLGFQTGFKTLDLYSKGIQKSSFWIIGGETSVGKTWFAQKLLVSAASDGAGVMMISLELSHKEMGSRIISMISGNSIFDVKTRDMSTNHRYLMAADFLKSNNFTLNDTCQTLEDVIFVIKSAKRKHGTSIFVVDYLQNIRVTKADGEYAALNQASLKLQRLSVEEDITIIGISQLDRGSLKGGGEVNLHSFKGSGNIENSADMALVLYRDKTAATDDLVCVSVEKNRLLGFIGMFKILQKITGEIEELYVQ